MTSPTSTSRVDLHCHSTASEISKLGVQRALGLPECATPPQEVYDLARRRGMSFVTITDHDTISGALEIAEQPGAFISEELTTWFKGEAQAVHVLCWGITPEDHAWLQAHARDLELVAEYLHEREIACALAHPFYAVEAPLLPRHRRRLAQLFPVWETRNGSRAPELNAPAAVYIETHGGTGVGGSDDHAGVDIGRTFTETPPAATPEELLGHVRGGRAWPRGEQGSAAKWAHSAMALATRVYAQGSEGRPDPLAVMRMVERVVREGDARAGAIGADLGPEDARRLLEAWLHAVGLRVRGRDLLAHLQAEDFSHAALCRQARWAHERRLRTAVASAVGAAASEERKRAPLLGSAAVELFEACVPAIPYVPAAAFLGREKAKLLQREGEPLRVALVADAVGGMHGVTHTLEQIRERGVPGHEVEVIGTDRNVDRRLPAVAEVDIPFYAGLQVGVPSLPALVEALAEGRYDVVHLVSPGPAGAAAAIVARTVELPLLGSYHTELVAYASLRSGDARVEAGMRTALAAFYGACRTVLSPSEASDASLAALGIGPERVARWQRGVDVERFDPAKRVAGRFAGTVNVLYAGRLTVEKGVDLLAESFLLARSRDPRLHLVLAGGGPEEGRLRARLGGAATFLGWLGGEDLPVAYASADAFLFCSRTDTYGQVIGEAQASALPVIAVAEGGPRDLIEDGRTGLLTPPDPDVIAQALLTLANRPTLRDRLGRSALVAAHERSWERALAQLAAGYRRALVPAGPAETRRAA